MASPAKVIGVDVIKVGMGIDAIALFDFPHRRHGRGDETGDGSEMLVSDEVGHTRSEIWAEKRSK
jgi:hypothetical protein